MRAILAAHTESGELLDALADVRAVGVVERVAEHVLVEGLTAEGHGAGGVLSLDVSLVEGQEVFLLVRLIAAAPVVAHAALDAGESGGLVTVHDHVDLAAAAVLAEAVDLVDVTLVLVEGEAEVAECGVAAGECSGHERVAEITRVIVSSGEVELEHTKRVAGLGAALDAGAHVDPLILGRNAGGVLALLRNPDVDDLRRKVAEAATVHGPQLGIRGAGTAGLTVATAGGTSALLTAFGVDAGVVRALVDHLRCSGLLHHAKDHVDRSEFFHGAVVDPALLRVQEVVGIGREVLDRQRGRLTVVLHGDHRHLCREVQPLDRAAGAPAARPAAAPAHCKQCESGACPRHCPHGYLPLLMSSRGRTDPRLKTTVPSTVTPIAIDAETASACARLVGMVFGATRTGIP